MTGQKIRCNKVLSRHWTRSPKTMDKAVLFRKWYRNNFLAASVGSRAGLSLAQTWSWQAENDCFISNLTNPINKLFLRLIYWKTINFSQCRNNCWHAYWCQEWNIKTSLLKISKIKYITLLSDSNLPVHFRAQQQPKYSQPQSKVKSIAAKMCLRRYIKLI